MRAFMRVLILLLAGVNCFPAHAQHALILQKLQEWNASAPQPSNDELLKPVREVAQKIYKDNANCLAKGITVDTVEPATAERYVFTEVAFRRMKNAWTMAIRHPGCDDASVRYMVMQSLDGSMTAIRVNRGQSYAHDSLIGDTLQLVILGVDAKFAQSGLTCIGDSKSKLGIVRIEKEESDLKPATFGVRYSGTWSEIWPIEKCGRIVEIPVSFTADGDGGAYHRSRINPDLFTTPQIKK